jgi:hypothetical protein
MDYEFLKRKSLFSFKKALSGRVFWFSRRSYFTLNRQCITAIRLFSLGAKVDAIIKPVCSAADPDPGSGAFLTPGSGMGKKSGSGSGIRIRNEQPGSYFREIRNNIFVVKKLKFSDAVLWCGYGKENSDTGWKKFGSGSKHPESATLRVWLVWSIKFDSVQAFLSQKGRNKIWNITVLLSVPARLAQKVPDPEHYTKQLFCARRPPA